MLQLLPVIHGVPDLPMKAERIDQSSQPPAVCFADGKDLGGPAFQRPCKKSIGIGNRKDHADRISAYRSLLRECLAVCRPAAYPKFRTVYGKTKDEGTIRGFVPVRLDGAKSLCIEIESLLTIRNGQPGGK